jgi:methylmalonyl-CoA mutase
MTDLSAEFKALADYRPTHKVRFVTAASLFDGHDAAINIMRRILQGMGAEVIHLGHNRSVDEVVTAALQEDVQGIAVSSYQGGHVEYFKYMVDLLRERGGAHIQVFGGGGGVIVPAEIRELQDYGVARIYSPEDGQRMGLAGMIGEMVMRCDTDLSAHAPKAWPRCRAMATPPGARWRRPSRRWKRRRRRAAFKAALAAAAAAKTIPVLGITGTGGAGKSSLTDELIRRLRLDQGDALRIAVISIDPSRRKSGGALLGDRIRMNAIGPWQSGPRVFMRSLATRDFGSEISQALPDVLCRLQGRRLRPHRRRDLGHRPGRRRHRAAGRRADVRDDARVRRRQPAGEDRHARLRRVRGHQQVRPQGCGRRAARRGQAGAAQQEAFKRRPSRCRSSAPWPAASTTTA